MESQRTESMAFGLRACSPKEAFNTACFTATCRLVLQIVRARIHEAWHPLSVCLGIFRTDEDKPCVNRGRTAVPFARLCVVPAELWCPCLGVDGHSCTVKLALDEFDRATRNVAQLWFTEGLLCIVIVAPNRLI